MVQAVDAEPPPRLRERDAETAAIRTLVDAVRGGAGASLAIDGVAGLGKSRLLSLAAERAQAGGLRVLAARGEALERPFAFGVATQLFGTVVARAEAEDPALLAGAAGLARNLREPGAGAPDGDGLFAVLHGVHWLTAALAERAPLLLTVDDLHWSDAPSLRLLLYLLDRLEGLPVGVVVAIREGEPCPAEVERLLGRLRAACGGVVRLAPLSAEATAAAVRERIAGADAALCRTVAELTAGNPLLVGALLEATGGDPGGLPAAAPAPVTRWLAVRLEQLGGEAERLAEAVATLEPDASLRRASALAGLDDRAAQAAAERLERAGILTGSEPLRYVHPLLRGAVDARRSSVARSRSHLEAARRLHADGAPPQKVATHLLAGELCGEGWALDALRAAARSASARGAPEAAVTHLRRAAAAAFDPDARVDVLVELATAEAAAGLAEAGDHLDEAIAITRNPRRRVEVLATLGEARYVRSDYAGAVDALGQGLAELGGADAGLEARLLAAVATAAALAPDRAAAAAELVGRPIARLLAGEPEHPTLPERVLLAYAAGGGAASLALDAGRAVALARRALAGGDPLADLGRIVAEPLVAALVMADELDDALRLYTGMLDDARERGALPAFANLLPMRATCWYRRGGVREAIADAQDAVRLCAELPSENLGSPTGRAVAAAAWLDRGDLRRAAELVDVPDAEQRWGFLPVFGLLLMARGRVALARGAPAEALADLRDGGARMTAAGFVNPASWDWRGDAALAAARLGESGAARELADEEVTLARGFGAPRALGSALRVLGQIEGGRTGIALLEESVETLERSSARLEHARALLDLGGALRRAGDRTEARRRLEDGVDRAHRCGADALTERGLAELRTLGLRPRRPAVSGPHALTPSELRTATMAAAGQSNRAIAQELFLTVRTVESHLTGAYRKLAITSRRELPGALERREASP